MWLWIWIFGASFSYNISLYIKSTITIIRITGSFNFKHVMTSRLQAFSSHYHPRDPSTIVLQLSWSLEGS